MQHVSRRSSSALSRRSALGRVAAIGAALGLGGGLRRAAAQEGTPAAMANHPIVGTWLNGQTWQDLRQAMWGGPWHILHFIGHGDFDAKADEGVIALADETVVLQYNAAGTRWIAVSNVKTQASLDASYQAAPRTVAVIQELTTSSQDFSVFANVFVYVPMITSWTT